MLAARPHHAKGKKLTKAKAPPAYTTNSSFPVAICDTKDKKRKLEELPVYVPNPVYTLVTGSHKKRKTKAKKVIPMAKRKHHTEAMAAKAQQAKPQTLAHFLEELETNYLRDNADAALEFALLQKVHKMTPEEAKDAHSTFKSYILEEGMAAALAADFVDA